MEALNIGPLESEPWTFVSPRMAYYACPFLANRNANILYLFSYLQMVKSLFMTISYNVFLAQVAQVVRCIGESKPWEEITKINRAKCRCGHEDCMCGISIMVTKATCPCECDGECPGA